MPEHPDRFEITSRLKARVHEVGARFLLTELETGLALLDVVDTSQDRESNERRRALALEAYEVVAHRLARTGADALSLTDAERERIGQLREELGKRLGR